VVVVEVVVEVVVVIVVFGLEVLIRSTVGLFVAGKGMTTGTTDSQEQRVD